jgi:hypothetical protein
MGARLLAALAGIALSACPGWGETLGDILNARGFTPPASALPHLGQTVQEAQVLADERDVLVVYTVGQRESVRLHVVRFQRISQTWRTAALEWSVSTGGGAPNALEPDWCRSALSIRRFSGGFLVGSHINPSAECTIVLGDDLTVSAVLAGWPVATFADGRIVYQRNQVHFASSHPVALALFNPRRLAEVALYPRKPYQTMRAAHIAKMRGIYTERWCNVHNHPCDPDVFNEHVGSVVVTDARGGALAFVVAWDNTAGWSDAERWGRLEAFRELRAALARWDGRDEPPADLYRNLAAGLARVRNAKWEAHVAAALGDQPALRELVAAALAGRPAAGQDERSWFLALDARWADAETWRRLGHAVEVPDEFTEVVYVYAGLSRPDTIRYRELQRRDFEARFGGGAPGRALQPDVLRQIFGADLE